MWESYLRFLLIVVVMNLVEGNIVSGCVLIMEEKEIRQIEEK